MNSKHWPALLGLALLVVFPSLASAQYAPGRGSLGGSIGYPHLISTGELRAGQKPRIIGKLHFQYVFNTDLRLSMKGGFGWVGYDSEEPAPFPFPDDRGGFDVTRIDQLTVWNPFSATVQYTRMNGSWLYFLGVGPGLSRIHIMNDRETIFDPTTFERHNYWSWAVAGEGGAEYFLPSNKNVSFDLAASVNYMLQDHAEEFPRGYAGKHGLLDISFGVNVYFSPFGSPQPATPPAATPEATPAPAPEAAPADTTGGSTP